MTVVRLLLFVERYIDTILTNAYSRGIIVFINQLN